MAYTKKPFVSVGQTSNISLGWDRISSDIKSLQQNKKAKRVIVECYEGVDIDQVIDEIEKHFPDAPIFRTSDALLPESEIIRLTQSDITDDRIFGRMTKLVMIDFFNQNSLTKIDEESKASGNMAFVIGIGASFLLQDSDVGIYADMPRWEIQQRMRSQSVANLGLSNFDAPMETKYKRGYFLDWRVCDLLKKDTFLACDYILDTTDQSNPKMITQEMYQKGLDYSVNQPFSLVPFFDPGPWGGQWMKEKFHLDPSVDNYAWCFNCVPEENSLLFGFDKIIFETPAINLVFFRSTELLGQKVVDRFGKEFPIRFDFLDTMEGGNLSLQVHPTVDYIQSNFGMSYTQDESYYILDADPEAQVYLGLQNDIASESMISALKQAQSEGLDFDANRYTLTWPAKKHDHFLIPAGTVHCSGAGCMVLEISATPYIFTFKLWDWGRVGMDGRPRPINIDRGAAVIQWDRQKEWTESNLINQVNLIAEEDGWREESTGLHSSEFIETRRFVQRDTTQHLTGESVNVLMLVEGKEALVESPIGQFEPFRINYAEAFVISANIPSYTIRPYGQSEGEEIIIMKAFVRT